MWDARWTDAGSSRARFVNRFLTSDVNDNLVTEKRLRPIPSWRSRWGSGRGGHDAIYNVDRAMWAVKETEGGVREALRRFSEVAEASGDEDDVWCNAVRDAIPHLEAVVGPLRSLLAEELSESV